MEKILQSIFVHVDASSKTLANNAIAQLLIKLLYTCDKPIKKDEFARMIDEQTHMSISTSDSFDAIMDTKEVFANRFISTIYILNGRKVIAWI